tara:strand:+ start:268 stop:1758 length:1491 start_codon:yes stop_codon:yes gene_type:complete
MNKDNLLIKKLKKQFLSINNSIENSFNKLKYFKDNLKKTRFTKNNIVFVAVASAGILIFSYFLIPTLYNKSLIQSQIKNHILKKYKISVKFNENIKYGLLPTPHFVANNLSIIRKKKEIGLAKKFKVFIATNNFLRINEIEIKDLSFGKTDFNVQKNDLLFFKELLETEPNENSILIKNSNIFYKDENEEVLFINKIFNSEFYYDSNNLQNVLLSKNKIFNVPYKLKIENNKFNKKFSTNFSSKKIRLNLKNEFFYEDELKKGLLDILFVNKSTALDYEIKKNYINFSSKNTKNNYNGKIEIKPFYLTTNLDYEGLSTKNLFDNKSLLIDLIKSEIFNNKNLNANIKFKLKDITNVAELRNLLLNINVKEGNINLSNSTLMWKEDLKILLDESFLNYDGNQINLDGRITLEFEDLDNFYRSFQIKKIHRKKIDKIELYFVYDFNQNLISFSNARIDGSPNLKIEEYFDSFNESNNRVFNKVKFKNFVSDFFKTYAG